ncbi:M48 family metallopeptidase [Falsigemmobacter faecalis]|nr:M48 family metallopeptidase [Falsigemmobacter faecalis]
MQPDPLLGTTADLTSPAQSFVYVLATVEPVAEATCREKRPDLNCDFRIFVDPDLSKPPNAFHRLDPETGRPVIGFTAALIAEARSPDELAFVLGHEAGHHLAGHIPRQQRSAAAGAMLAGTLAVMSGAGVGALEQAAQLGAAVGARSYSKDFELEADAIGTLIAWRAGFDPERGAGFFTRLPDPGNRFLGSHPPNAARMQTVAATMSAIRQGRLR